MPIQLTPELAAAALQWAEATARQGGLDLTQKYMPLHDAEVHRGDGCIACPSFGTSCDGLEREWWTDLDWEDMYDRMKGD